MKMTMRRLRYSIASLTHQTRKIAVKIYMATASSSKNDEGDNTINGVGTFIHGSNRHISHFELNGLSNMAYELPNPEILTEMLDCCESGPLLSHYSVRATWNQIICTAHRLQLSVRTFLDLPEIQPILSMIPQTVKFFRRSSIAATYLKKAFDESVEFKWPLRPLLDVKTRWDLLCQCAIDT